VGFASFDLVFGVDHHPQPDEKFFASSLLSCSGGPAANAAVAVSRLGLSSAFAGYLGNDPLGCTQYQQLTEAGVHLDFVNRGDNPNPLSVITVKPGGERSIVSYRPPSIQISATDIDFSLCKPRVILFDGHQPELSGPLMEIAEKQGAITVIDAGSVHKGTRELVQRVDYVVASEKFAFDFTSEDDAHKSLEKLGRVARSTIITLGESGLLWQHEQAEGSLPAFQVNSVDTTGAGDAFHGAFAAGLASHKSWDKLLRYASAAAALNCTKYGGSRGMPSAGEVEEFLKQYL
jgi:sulfofructose kinase